MNPVNKILRDTGKSRQVGDVVSVKDITGTHSYPILKNHTMNCGCKKHYVKNMNTYITTKHPNCKKHN
jgi:hypothetical protein